MNRLNYKKFIAFLIAAFNFVPNAHIVPYQTFAENELLTAEQQVQVEPLTESANKEQQTLLEVFAEIEAVSEEPNTQQNTLVDNEAVNVEQSENSQLEALAKSETATVEQQAQPETLTVDENKGQTSQPVVLAENKAAREEQSENSQPEALTENKVASDEQSENSQPETLVERKTAADEQQASHENYCVVEIFFNDDVGEEQQTYPTVLYIIETSLNDEAESEQQLSQVVTLTENANKEQYVKVKPFAKNVNKKQNFQTKTFCIENHMYDSELNTKFPFFLLVSRMQGINRWHILNNMKYENLEDHSFETAVIVHILANIKNEYFGGQLNPEQLVMLALFHDMAEIFTGDIPSPVHYNNCVKDGFELIEKDVAAEILKTLPEKLRRKYVPIIMQNNLTKEDLKLLKAADKISALMKCIREIQLGNKAFLTAAESIYKALRATGLEEVDFFLENFIDKSFLIFFE